MDLINAR